MKFTLLFCFLGFITLTGSLGDNQDKREAFLIEENNELKDVVKILEARIEKLVYKSMCVAIVKDSIIFIPNLTK